MAERQLDEKVLDFVYKLQDKYESVGEDLADHLEGILYSDYTNYWDYVGIDALLNLQKPKTKYPDEMIFIIYHQITELYFKIIIHELELIGFNKDLTKDFFIKKMNRINKYFGHLSDSFHILVSGMETDQFMKFRTALTPSSGFQSIQYRLIELWSTEFSNLVTREKRADFDSSSSIKEMYEHLHWKEGATERETGKKTLTLTQFEEKYEKLILRKGEEFRTINMWSRYQSLPLNDRKDEILIAALKQFDVHANINWRLAHYRYAAKYLKRESHVARSTGGTNWQEYLPPQFQKQIFYPGLWTVEELENWGKSWVENVFLSKSAE